MLRYLRAFIKAWQLTLRGEGVSPHFRPLERWVEEGLRKVAQAVETADAHQINRARREDIQLKLDGRMTSLEQTLEMVRHNLATVYPRLMRLDDPYAVMVIQSSNINDQYRVSQFALGDAVPSAELKQALAALDRHLMSLPPLESRQSSST